MTDFHFIYILLVHFCADFALQTNEMATKKSTDDKWLFYHVALYSAVWFLAAFAILPVGSAIGFAVITFFCHYITDFITSRINKSFFDKGDMHNGFVGIGFDQILHYIQLWYTLKLLL